LSPYLEREGEGPEEVLLLGERQGGALLLSVDIEVADKLVAGGGRDLLVLDKVGDRRHGLVRVCDRLVVRHAQACAGTTRVYSLRYTQTAAGLDRGNHGAKALR
jgi:hypothetical protein